MRVAIVTESFLPHMNGVTGSVLQILRHLDGNGHNAIVFAPAAGGMPEHVSGAQVAAIQSVALPGYRDVRIGTSTTGRMTKSLQRFRPDVIHLASPFALGWPGIVAANKLQIPAVAAYQTDVAAYTHRYGITATTGLAERHIARLHRRATLTLAPSSESEEQLERLGIDRVRRWGRGVDLERFHPRHNSTKLKALWNAEVVIGYAGRLAPEKQVEDLAVLQDIPGARVVIVGDGPSRARLEAMMPHAVFLGHLEGHALAEAMASFDLFVHPGESETFGQTLQEAHASAVPVVATDRGGPRDLVRMGIDGWLYRPGDLDDLRMRVTDLTGDARKRRALGRAGFEAVQERSWGSVCDQLLGHYELARHLNTVDVGLRAPRERRPEPPVTDTVLRPRRYVALGDSLTEGLCDPAADGSLRGWADRLALLLASRGGLRYANLAVRSKRICDVAGMQLARALELRPDLVSILIGANDLVKLHADIPALAAELEETVRTLRSTGAEVILVTPFLPDRCAAGIFAARFSRFASELTLIARRTGSVLIDTGLDPTLGERRNWGEDLVHLSSRGHRSLAYRAGDAIGVPHADALGALDESLHEHEQISTAAWWRRHALPWLWRRLHGGTAGDGLLAKHDDYIYIGRSSRMHDVAVH